MNSCVFENNDIKLKLDVTYIFRNFVVNKTLVLLYWFLGFLKAYLLYASNSLLNRFSILRERFAEFRYVIKVILNIRVYAVKRMYVVCGSTM